MNISIWDLDYYYKTSKMPNITCMKLSSYHKQKGDNINFITEKFHLTLSFDIIYIIKELDDTPFPNRKILDDKRTFLLGKGFKYYNVKQLNSIVASCRPDYLLYENNSNNKYTNANFINFYSNNKLIKKQQEWHNVKKNKKNTVVTDEYFWKASDEDIIYCLKILKKERNIIFLKPISLKKILLNKNIEKLFLSLHFSSGTEFKWINDYSSEFEEVKNIIFFLLKLKQRTKSNLGFIPIKALLQEDIELNLLRCFQIIDLFKKNKLYCRIILQKNITTKNTILITSLEKWTKNYFKLSYIEFILHPFCLTNGVEWYIILNNPIKWYDKKIDFLLYLLTDEKWKEWTNLLASQWGYEELNLYKINYDTIKKYIAKII